MTHIALLVLLGSFAALAPLLLIHIIARIPRPIPILGGIVSGNPLLAHENTNASGDPFTPSLLELTRTREPADLRATVLGLRFLPVESTAPILDRCARSTDTELQLYAQTVKADGQGKIHSSFLRLRDLAAHGAPASSASFISTGLRLLDSPLTPDSEHASILKNVLPAAEHALAKDENHPRLVFESARLLTRAQRMDDARALLARLPQGSPLHEELSRLITHQGGILAAQTPPTEGYEIR